MLLRYLFERHFLAVFQCQLNNEIAAIGIGPLLARHTNNVNRLSFCWWLPPQGLKNAVSWFARTNALTVGLADGGGVA